jgi:hypothetical protein
MSDQAKDSGERSATRVISQRTPVTLGLIIVGVSALLGMASLLIGAIWWAATLQQKLDTVIEDYKTLAKDKASEYAKLESFEHRLTVIESLEHRVIALEQKKLQP